MIRRAFYNFCYALYHGYILKSAFKLIQNSGRTYNFQRFPHIFTENVCESFFEIGIEETGIFTSAKKNNSI